MAITVSLHQDFRDVFFKEIIHKTFENLENESDWSFTINVIIIIFILLVIY